MSNAVTIIVGMAVLALFIWALIFSIKSSRKHRGCSGGCAGCPYASGCAKAAEGKAQEFTDDKSGREAEAENPER